jgi:1-deoxy-D-xylulose-5-phosphate reductoisomerase
MELPILYALTYPNRIEDVTLQTYDPIRSSPLTFEPIDDEAFPLFKVGVHAGRTGGCAPAVYNAANEIAVQAFLESTIRFPEMADLVSETIDRIGNSAVTGIKDVLEVDQAARSVATEVAHSLSKTKVEVTR